MLAALGTVSLGRVVYIMLVNLFKALEQILLMLADFSAGYLMKHSREMLTAPPKCQVPKHILVFLANVLCA